MDRSNSVSSNASTGSRSGSSAPFAYQTRLLERTSSRSGAGPLSRSNSQSNINLLTNTTGSSVGSVTPRRWTSVHRVGNSLDLVRGKWEERSREPEAMLDATPSSSPTKDTSRSNTTNLACYGNDQSNIDLLTNTTGPSVGSVTPKRWTSVHRVGSSLDLVRDKWEERSRESEALLDDTPSSSPTKDTSRSNITNLACYGNDLHCIRSTGFGRPTPYSNEPHFSNWDNKYTKVPQFK